MIIFWSSEMCFSTQPSVQMGCGAWIRTMIDSSKGYRPTIRRPRNIYFGREIIPLNLPFDKGRKTSDTGYEGR